MELKKSTNELASCSKLKDVLENQLKELEIKGEEKIKVLEIEKKKAEKELLSSQIKINDLVEKLKESNFEDEMEMWKNKYQKLLDKVEPFMEQLDAFAAEKAFMLSKTNAAEAEATQLGRKYAELLGHQNQRQKIRHVVKLKDDNFLLKQENLKLKNQVSSLQKQLIKNRKPRFDPSQAFKCNAIDNVENQSPN